MKKFILLTVVVASGILLLAGCGEPSSPPEAQPLEPPPELYDKVWISPGKVEVGHFYAGTRAEYPVTIHNGHDEPTEFSITYKVPSSVEEGFVVAPDAAQDWVIIAAETLILEAKETREVMVAVEMPEGAEAPDKWEFWVAVKDSSQTGMVQTELACRWLVTMQ